MHFEYDKNPYKEDDYPKIIVDVCSQKISVLVYSMNVSEGKFSYSNIFELASIQLCDNKNYRLLLPKRTQESQKIDSGKGYAIYTPQFTEEDYPNTPDDLVLAMEKFMAVVCPNHWLEILVSRGGEIPKQLYSGKGVIPLAEHFEQLGWNITKAKELALV